jgi:hypothetical protein
MSFFSCLCEHEMEYFIMLKVSANDARTRISEACIIGPVNITSSVVSGF